MARLKIATYNINGIRARLGALLEWLERAKPDIACLQELKAPDEAFPLGDIKALGYGALWHGQKSWNGVAILARGAQPEERQRGLPDDPDATQSRYLEANVHGLRVACLYLPNGNPWPGPKFDYKLEWFAQLRKRAARLLKDRMPTVMCGDFNVVPTDELDIYNPASWRKDALLQPESREAWFELLAQGWADSIRAVHGDARIYTFWDYFRKHWERDAGLRIDPLLLSPQLSPLLHDAGVDRWVRGRQGASDHAPTWVVLDAGADGRAGLRAGKAGPVSRAPGAATGTKKRGAAASRAAPGDASRAAESGSPSAGKAKAARKTAGSGEPAASKWQRKSAETARGALPATKTPTKRATKTAAKKSLARAAKKPVRPTPENAVKRAVARKARP
jgi:exodeoxyribonuclease-3